MFCDKFKNACKNCKKKPLFLFSSKTKAEYWCKARWSQPGRTKIFILSGKANATCKLFLPSFGTLQSLTGKYREIQGNPCNKNRDPAMKTGVPCNEYRFFPVGIDLQGVPCKPYRVWVCSADFLSQKKTDTISCISQVQGVPG